MTDTEEKTTRAASPPPTPLATKANLDVGAAWRKRQKEIHAARATPIELELPSGITVMAIRAPMKWLVSFGRVPDQLLPRVEEMINLIEANDPKSIEERLTDQLNESPETEWAKFNNLMDGCWFASVTYPEFTNDPVNVGPMIKDKETKEEFPSPPYYIGDVDYFDKMYLFQWCQGVDEDVEAFFLRQEQIVGAVENGEGVQLSPTRNIGTDRSGRLVVSDTSGSSGVPVRELHNSPDRGKGGKKRKAKQS